MMAIPRLVVRTARRLLRDVQRTFCTARARMRAGRIGKGVRVNRATLFTRFTEVGDYANFNGMVVRGNGAVAIGRYFHSGRDCNIITSFHNYNGGSRIPYGPGTEDIHKPVTIDDFVWIGDGVTILGGSHIGEGAVIQAGSTVVSDIPAMAVAGGHPARVFTYRDKEHFLRLKEQGLFH
jgi:chloramphenicol O-acetyltransferase type B